MMAQKQQTHTHENGRHYRITPNRGRARRRVRYIETGGAETRQKECTLCQDHPA